MKNLIRIFTPSDAAEANTNAQNLTVREIVSRLPPDSFHVTMFSDGDPDSRILNRTNTQLVPYSEHGNTLRLLKHCLHPQPDFYFFPRLGPLDRAFFEIKKRFPLRTKLVTYIVTGLSHTTWSTLLPRSIERADTLCANSGLLATAIQERFGVEATVIFDGVDRRFFFPAWKPTCRLTVLYAGSFVSYKRAEVVVEQAARFPHVEFRLAGQGPTQAACRAICSELGCGNVSFLGRLTQAELANEMRRANVFFFPSILEGNPQVLLQAAGCGLPCVAMNSYRSEYVRNDETGFLAPDDHTLASRLRILLENHELRCRMSHAAANHALNFDWDKIAVQWAEVFQKASVTRRTLLRRTAYAS